MRTAEPQPTYVVYPAALFDGWEVVKEGAGEPAFFESPREAMEYATARARADAASVKLENWFGETIGRWDYPRRPR